MGSKIRRFQKWGYLSGSGQPWRLMAKHMAPGARQDLNPGSAQPWESQSIFLSLSFLIYEMGIVKKPTHSRILSKHPLEVSNDNIHQKKNNPAIPALPGRSVGCIVPGTHTQAGVCVCVSVCMQFSQQNCLITHNIPHFTFDFCFMNFQEDYFHFQIPRGFTNYPCLDTLIFKLLS